MRTRFATKLRYLAGAVLFASVNNLILIAGDAAGFGYVGLTVTCFFVTGALAYAFHTKFTFRQRIRIGGYMNFLAGQFVGLLITLAGLYLLSHLIGLPMLVAAPGVTVLMLAFNYAAAKFAARDIS